MTKEQKQEVIALEKSIRLGLSGDAVYWAISLAEQLPFKALKTLLPMSALQDAVAPIYTEMALDAWKSSNPTNWAVGDFACNAYGLSVCPKMWEGHLGRKLIEAMNEEPSEPVGSFSAEELLNRFEMALVASSLWIVQAELLAELLRRKIIVDTIRILREFVSSSLGWGKALDLIDTSIPMVDKTTKQGGPRVLFNVLLSVENAQWHRTVPVVGRQDFLGSIMFRDALEEYRHRVRDNTMRPIPYYVERKEFGSTWENYAYLAGEYVKYGNFEIIADRLEDDETDGWQPEIREQDGLYFVQSEEHPNDSYEVNFEAKVCQCPHNQIRGVFCKHLEKVREHINALPFTVVLPGGLDEV